MGKKKKNAHRARSDPRLADVGGGAPNPQLLLRELLADEDMLTEGEHCWVVNLVYPLADDDEAQRLAYGRSLAGGRLTWRPGAEATPTDTEGPYCLHCKKLRGPLPVTTPCTGTPAKMRRNHAQRDLQLLPRGERNTVKAKVRRAERDERLRLREAFGPSPADLAAAAEYADYGDMAMPEHMGWGDPDWALPEAAEVQA